jgi:hypothetical protein
VLLTDGTALITGGSQASNQTLTSSAWIYDPVANTITSTGSPMTTARSQHTATLLTGAYAGQILITGGNGGSTGALQSAEIYYQ